MTSRRGISLGFLIILFGIAECFFEKKTLIDEKERLDLAEKIINEKKIFDFTVMRGLGYEDSLWKTFAVTVHFIPAYILVDKDGIVRYAGSGGENLKGLKDKIAQLKLEN